MTEVIAIGARLWEGLKSFVLPASGRFEDDPQFWALFEGRPLLLHITETEPITGVESMDDLEIVRAIFRNHEIDSACCVELPIMDGNNLAHRSLPLGTDRKENFMNKKGTWYSRESQDCGR